MRAVFERLRFIIVVAAWGLGVTALVTLAWALARAALLVVVLVKGGWRQDASVISLLEVVDLFLVATVQVIVSLGLYKLFVGDIQVPAWLSVHNLSDLKRPIVHVLVLVLANKFLERMLVADARETLYYGAATALVTVALVTFVRFGEHPS